MCGQGDLGADWAVAARAALEQDQLAVQALTAARAATAQARSAVMTVVREVEAPPLTDEDLTTLPAARAAFEAFTKLPADGHRALADHVEETLPVLRAAYESLREEATTLIQQREDVWAPVALPVAEWITRTEGALAAEPK
ncbi:hypothetical protein [Mycolicibacterium arenosum]|uniref:Uncharacterized protein n=1 Tax=Mycolicibacterium arenosum TaxID=2952157 RepID=A0ABT1M4I0_9MYCO|nr:hypothetical protein [Mycolicibacterium sp. CAU 1645]MCP9274074.1 hypothetical protein [Mycolicibacterium sp. CAU 1645]